ncbi:hypothetical protein SKAU_G00036700 [Synaphobranchus kaupii]|uniref:Uncharacterized protein n=1 Tax=Synaphobranchus kaupii TaxID=118154 RepID=A0A9Q1GH70_SYNKA|nr:hypothetical protein SKAU_G00036700 [Synaphobranchus kaupii]
MPCKEKHTTNETEASPHGEPEVAGFCHCRLQSRVQVKDTRAKSLRSPYAVARVSRTTNSPALLQAPALPIRTTSNGVRLRVRGDFAFHQIEQGQSNPN